MIHNFKLNEEIQIIDPTLAQKYNEAQKQINNRLKKINQLQSEIVTYKQQMAFAQEQAMKNNQAQIKQSEEIQKTQPNTNNQKTQSQLAINQPTIIESIRVNENIESYIMEDEDEDDNEDEELDYSDEYDEKIGDEDEFLFYFKIVDEIDNTVYKAYKDFTEDRWELKVVEGETNHALEETTFETDFTKLEIINYLAEIYGDVEEIFEDEFDDKNEIDKEYFN